MITRTSQYNQRGEVAALMTLVAMGIMLAGLIVGTNIGSSRQAQTTQSRAAAVPIQLTTAPSPFPAPAVPPVFTPERFTCQLGFRYSQDPTVYKLLLRRAGGSSDVLDISRGLPQTISQNRDGVSVFFDPNKNYPNPGLKDFESGRAFKVGDVVVSLRPSNSVNNRYFLYDRSAAPWMNVAGPVELYIEFDKGPSNPDKNRYFQVVSIDNNCGTVTPTPPIVSPTPTATPTATPTPGIPTVTLTPAAPQCNSTCQLNSDCPSGLVCYKGPDLPVEGDQTNKNPDQQGVCRHPLCTAENDCQCNPTNTEPPPTACKFDALAYIEECDKIEFDAKDPLKAPTCKSIKRINLDQVKNSNEWGVSNNKQKQDSPTNLYAYIQKFNKTAHLWTFNKTFTSKEPIRINEYRSGEDAIVKTFFDRENYRIIENFLDGTNRGNVFPQKGKRIDTCTNSGEPGQFACNRESEQATSELDQIGGLTVACGNSIVYGWTVVKCNPLDIIVILDTSTSMRDFDNNSGSRDPNSPTTKLKVAVDTLTGSFLPQVQFTRGDRVALIQFNKTATLLQDLTNSREAITTKINDATTQEGTCIECALRSAYQLIQSHKNEYDGTRRVAVVLLTDGLPNSEPGNPNQNITTQKADILISADQIKSLSFKPRIAAVGYGNPKIVPGPDVPNLPGIQLYKDIILPIASEPALAFTTDPSVQKQSGELKDIYEDIATRLNSCATADLHFAQVLRATDINGDGVVNTIDYFMVLDNYFAKGGNIKEDINNDGVVNSLDLSLVTDRIGQSYTASN